MKQRNHHCAVRIGALFALALLGAQVHGRAPQAEIQIGLYAEPDAADAQRSRAKLEADPGRAGVSACEDQTAQAVNKLRSLLVTSPG